MDTLSPVYKDSIELFYKSFDVPKLVYEILSRVKEPAEPGRMYNATITKAEVADFRVRIEFKTDEETYINLVYNLENRLSAADDFLGRTGCTLNNVSPCVGRKFQIYYESVFNVVLLKEIKDENV